MNTKTPRRLGHDHSGNGGEIITTYEVRHRQRDDMWVVYSGGTPIRTYSTRRAAARKARDLAKPGDSLTVRNMDGSVSRQYDEPRR